MPSAALNVKVLAVLPSGKLAIPRSVAAAQRKPACAWGGSSGLMGSSRSLCSALPFAALSKGLGVYGRRQSGVRLQPGSDGVSCGCDGFPASASADRATRVRRPRRHSAVRSRRRTQSLRQHHASPTDPSPLWVMPAWSMVKDSSSKRVRFRAISPSP
jgi:hypothetical protein